MFQFEKKNIKPPLSRFDNQIATIISKKHHDILPCHFICSKCTLSCLMFPGSSEDDLFVSLGSFLHNHLSSYKSKAPLTIKFQQSIPQSVLTFLLIIKFKKGDLDSTVE